jgi:hypothetical protein
VFDDQAALRTENGLDLLMVRNFNVSRPSWLFFAMLLSHVAEIADVMDPGPIQIRFCKMLSLDEQIHFAWNFVR